MKARELFKWMKERAPKKNCFVSFELWEEGPTELFIHLWDMSLEEDQLDEEMEMEGEINESLWFEIIDGKPKRIPFRLYWVSVDKNGVHDFYKLKNYTN